MPCFCGDLTTASSLPVIKLAYYDFYCVIWFFFTVPPHLACRHLPAVFSLFLFIPYLSFSLIIFRFIYLLRYSPSFNSMTLRVRAASPFLARRSCIVFHLFTYIILFLFMRVLWFPLLAFISLPYFALSSPLFTYCTYFMPTHCHVCKSYFSLCHAAISTTSFIDFLRLVFPPSPTSSNV